MRAAPVMSSSHFRQISTLFEEGALGHLDDHQLLERFLRDRGSPGAEAVFEALVRRHDAMVRRVCGKLLVDRADVDDAVQATFLVLARRAGSIRDRDSLANWLYGVAHRVASRFSAESARRRSHERRAGILRAWTSEQAPQANPIPELLEEVSRLPDRYRAPIVLCYLEGQSHQQAASALGCPLRSFQTRLLRAKARLRTRLTRRGLAPALTLSALDMLRPEVTEGGEVSVSAEQIRGIAREAIDFVRARGTSLPTVSGPAGTAAQSLALGILGTTLRPNWRPWIGLLLLASFAAAAFSVMAYDRKPGEPVRAISGTVRDPDGKPIAGAEVWFLASQSKPERETAHAVTDAEGRYALKLDDDWSKTPIHERGTIVWAFAQGHQISTASAHEALDGKRPSVDLTLGSPTDTAFVVLGPDGRPVVGAIVEPFHFKTHRAYDITPPAMRPRLQAVSDPTGRAALPTMPREGFLSVQVTTPSLGIQQQGLTDKATEPTTRIVRLRATARVEGRIVAPKPEQAQGVRIFLSTTEGSGRAGDPNKEGTSGFAEVVTGDDGTFTVPAIATGTLDLGVRPNESLPVRPKLPQSIVVQKGLVNRLEIPLVAAVRVRGKIQVKDTGKPLSGASIYIYYGSNRQGATVVSDEQGQYESFVLPGDVKTQVIAMPGEYVQIGEPWNESFKVPSDAASFDLPSIDVVPARTIEGKVVNGEGKPIAHVRVAGQIQERLYGYGESRDDGQFTLAGVPPGEPLGYKVFLNDEGWVEGTVVMPKPLLLRVGKAASGLPQQGGTISGTVIDTLGKPVAGSKVVLTIELGRQPGNAPGSTIVNQKRSTLTTDPTGRFETTIDGTSGARFRAIAAPENHTMAGSDWIEARENQPVSFAPIRVSPLRSISGRVVDTERRPVIGATVLSWGNPAPLTSAVTGPDGIFQLDKIPLGDFRLSVEAPGYRFHGEVHDRADKPIELKLRREDQPPARKIRPRGPILDRPDAVALAWKVIRPYSERALGPESGIDADARSRLLEVLAKIDPDEAWRKCQAGEEPWNHNAVRIAVAHRLISGDVDRAAEILPFITSEFWRNWTRFELFDALPRSREDLRLRLLDQAIGDARKSTDANARAVGLIRVAERRLDQGRKDDARRLLDEAQPMAKVLDLHNERLAYTRLLIGPLARLDLKAAESLIPTKGDERTANDLRGLIGQAVAAEDPAAAERLLGQMTWNNSATYIVHACTRMAPVDLPRARRLATTIKSDVLRGYAQGKMAERLAETELPAARELLQEAFQSFAQVMGRGYGGAGVWGPASASVMAAALLPIVERVDPDRLSEAVARMAALRWFPRTQIDLTMTTPDTSGIEAIRTGSVLAAMLVRYDRTLAQSIARPIVDHFRTPLAELENRYLDRYAVFPMLTLADPDAMAELVEVLPEPEGAEPGLTRDVARLLVAGALAEPENEYMALFRRSFSDLEIVERED